MKKFKRRLTTTQITVFSFLPLIFIGAILLSLPISSASGQATSFVDALFTAATSVCVTGLVVVPTAVHWSLFGKIVILILIQIGGLGVVTVTSFLLLALGRKFSLSSRILLSDAFNLDTLKGLVQFLKKAFLGTLIAEAVGAVCYLPVFIPRYGAIKGVWFSIFHSVSAFCNAGLDIIGETGYAPYVHSAWANFVTMALIVSGGIGFIVWWNIGKNIKSFLRTKRKRDLISFSLHTKLVLCMTAGLIITGTVLFTAFEYNNPKTIGNFSFPQKVLAALFQSVTTRTAGFATVSQKGLTVPSVILSIILMFIGGSSVGTAGGVKVTTVAVIVLSVVATIRGRDDTTCFQRRISEKTVKKSIAVVLISFLTSILAIVLLRFSESGDTVDIIFEVYSALGTVGLTRDFTPLLSTFGKLLLSACMFLGRIGPISMMIVFTVRGSNKALRLPEEKVSVG